MVLFLLLGGVLAALTFLVFRPASKPAARLHQTPLQHTHGLGIGTWVLLIVAAGLLWYHLPWLVAHFPVHVQIVR